MPTIIMSKPASKLEPSLKKKAYAFLEKLGEDDTSPGLHIEPIANSADDKVRTGRVDQFYRAVLFRVPGKGEPMYVFYGIWPHDEAIAVAKKTRLDREPGQRRHRDHHRRGGHRPPSRRFRRPPAASARAASAAAPMPLLVSLGLDRKALVDVLGHRRVARRPRPGRGGRERADGAGRETPSSGRAWRSSTWPRASASRRSRTS